MTHKLQNTRCTLRQTADSNTNSNSNSRFLQRSTDNPLKSLSFSLQSIKNPFTQTLPLKFPKNRIVKGFNNHMLTQTQYFQNYYQRQTKFKPGLRQSYLNNQHLQQKIQKKQKSKDQFYTFNQQSLDNNINQSSQSNSLEKLYYSSLQRQSKRIFHHKIAQETMKNPILIGQQNNTLNNKNVKKMIGQDQKHKNFSKGFKETFEWKTDLSKQKFNRQFNAKPKNAILDRVLTLNLTKSKQKRVIPKTDRNQRQRQSPKTSRDIGNQQTYTSIYISKRKLIGFGF